MRAPMLVTVFLSTLLSGCGGGGYGDGGSNSGGGYCVGNFLGGSTNWSCTNCSGLDPLDSVDDFDVAIDDNGYTYREFGIGSGGGQVTITATAPSNTAFPAGIDAGALMRFPTGTFSSIGVRFNTYNNGAPMDSQSGGQTATAGNVSGAGSDTYYEVNPLTPFDSVEAVVTVSGNAGSAVFRLYEFCGDK